VNAQLKGSNYNPNCVEINHLNDKYVHFLPGYDGGVFVVRFQKRKYKLGTDNAGLQAILRLFLVELLLIISQTKMCEKSVEKVLDAVTHLLEKLGGTATELSGSMPDNKRAMLSALEVLGVSFQPVSGFILYV
jgi:hypothetical protein